ncbi:nitroreductase [Streptomyces broussonetiae]|uniref:Nitroreductase n=1 Tax=Streptomyces broussonetiae TaxID=2686304 RepID=A0A6I6MWZ2_9ACTN|nr:nitroreductase [Streptomyces broussonetiae]
MDVYEAVASRRAVRAFRDDAVPRAVLERVLTAAARTPSGGNLQPWHTYVLTGAPLAELKKRTAERAAAGDPGDEPEYRMYPPEPKSPYRQRRSAAAARRFEALGIRREDVAARRAAVAANWRCFGAPCLLLCYIDRAMGSAQWSDLGMYLQTVMLLLRAEGLHSCAQMAWSVYHRSVAEVVSPAADLLLFAGLSIGFEDPSEPFTRTGRAPLAQTVTFLDDDAPSSPARRAGGLPGVRGRVVRAPSTPGAYGSLNVTGRQQW